MERLFAELAHLHEELEQLQRVNDVLKMVMTTMGAELDIMAVAAGNAGAETTET